MDASEKISRKSDGFWKTRECFTVFRVPQAVVDGAGIFRARYVSLYIHIVISLLLFFLLKKRNVFRFHVFRFLFPITSALLIKTFRD